MLFSQRSRWYHDKNRKRMNTWRSSVVLLSGRCSMAVNWLKAKQVSRGFPSTVESMYIFHIDSHQIRGKVVSTQLPCNVSAAATLTVAVNCGHRSRTESYTVWPTCTAHTHDVCWLIPNSLCMTARRGGRHMITSIVPSSSLPQKLTTRKWYKTNLSVSGVKNCCV